MPHYHAAAGIVSLCIVFLKGTIVTSSTDVPTFEHLRGSDARRTQGADTSTTIERADEVDTDHHYPYPQPDCDPPEIMAPDDVTVECGEDTSSHSTGGAMVSSDCSVMISELDSSTPGCGFTEVIQRTFKVTDEDDQSDSDSQIITIVDTTPPDITAPDDITVECGTNYSISPDPEGAGEPTTSDICSDDDEINTMPDDSFQKECGYAGVITRTWTATDECNITNSDDQTITIEDTTDPVFDMFPEDQKIMCNKDTRDEDVDPDNTGRPTASDTCSYIPDPTFMDKSHPLCGHNSHTATIKRTWTATDPCGNSVSEAQTIIVFDYTPPVFDTFPTSPLTVECGSDTSPDVTGEPTASDTCDNVTISKVDYTKFTGCGNNVAITRTWTAMDACYNTNTSAQEINTEDTVAPSVIFDDTCPQHKTLECGADLSPNATCTPTATDVCSNDDNIDLEHEDTEFHGCGGTVSIKRVWTATDECGNNAEFKQYVSTEDEVDPEFTDFPGDKHIECVKETKDEDVLPAETGIPTASDDCDDDVDVTFEDDNITICDGNEIITRIWTAADGCGNSISRNQTVTLQDTIDPVFTSFPPDIRGECQVDYPGNAIMITSSDDMPTATDTCSEVTIRPEYSNVPGCGYTDLITRTWIAEDDCGNSVSQNQTINITDTTPPVLEDFPGDQTVECNLETIDEDTSPDATGMPISFDTCSKDPPVKFKDKESPKCGGTKVITRSWKAMDDCGNESPPEDQLIAVVDTTDPVFEVFPDDVYVECGESTHPDDTGEPEAWDNCDNHVNVSYVDSPHPGCGHTETITRTWTATDNCGLSVSQDQIIYVKDTTPPMITCPDDVTIKCDDYDKDNCKDDTYKDDDHYDSKDDGYYDSKDDGYYDSKDYYKNYDPYCKTGVATAHDTCGPIKSIVFEDSTTGYDCSKYPQTVTRTWKATDKCAHLTSTCDQIITIEPKDYKDYESYDAKDDVQVDQDMVRAGDGKEQGGKDKEKNKEQDKDKEKAGKEKGGKEKREGG